MRYNVLSSQSGLSIIATVMVMMILALFAAVGVSLVTTGSNVAVQEERGLEAFYIADGGLQYAAKTNFFPYFAVASPPPPDTNPKPLGEGSFYTTVPTLLAGITAATAGPITVTPSTDGFILNPGDATNQYWIMICDTQAPDNNPTPPLLATTTTCEKISCTGKTATTFTGCTRGRDYSVGAAHLANAVVLTYSWIDLGPGSNPTLNRNLNANNRCQNNNNRICVTSTANFATSGFVRINNGTENNREDVFYNGKWTLGDAGANPCGDGIPGPAVCTACLGTVPIPGLGTDACIRRAYSDANDDNDGNYNNDSSNGVAQANGTTIYQSEISVLATSTGVVPGAILTGNIKRVVQGKIMPLQ
ncbi:MAG: hypothetical protein Q8M34_05785 [Thermodesulfovibrionales bacterium]|nr:hypothetical protein [Thermodesulfovibrionales bacterium]